MKRGMRNAECGIKTRGMCAVRSLVIMVILVGALTGKGALASWYGEEHRGRLMANGQRFDPDRLTAASWFYPMGTRLVVEHSGRKVAVTVTDRGPAWRLVRQGRVI